VEYNTRTLRKSLGQHFLKDENICRKIAASLALNEGSNLLEVGPGGGALTKYLLEIPGINFKAVEIDKGKVDYLLSRFPSLKEKIICADILACPVPFDNSFTVIGNFPYNISSQILFRILNWKSQVSEVIAMFQKEVAQRIVSDPGNKEYGILSVLVQAWYDTAYLFEIHENCFEPPPKVKSAVIKLTKRSITTSFSSEVDFIKLVKMSFNQRRKKLRNPLKSLFAENILQDHIFDKRAEELTVEDFAALTFRMKK
jgi:16S rRNA (adenine1518-N6/adenine1519-N6)-dimethyltransferase